MKERYQKPVIEIQLFNNAKILTLSTDGEDVDALLLD